MNAPVAVSHRRVLAIAVPMTLAYISTPLLGIVDTAVIGQLGDAALIGGIAVGSVIFSVIFTTFNFLRSGTTGLTAQAFGAGDTAEQAAIAWRALIVALACGLAVVALRAPLLDIALVLMAPSGEVVTATRTYFGIRILAAPVTLANYAILGWFLGLGRARTGLLLQTVLNGANMALNAWFVLGLGWGVAGVAWGTVIGEAVTAALGLGLMLGAFGPWRRPDPARLADRASFARLFALNRDIMIRSFALFFAFAFFTAQGAREGDTALAANAVLLNFFFVCSYVLDGFATAAEQIAGAALGARSRAAFVAAVRLTLVWSLALAGLLALVLVAAGGAFIDVMTTSPEVRAAARAYLPWAAATPLFGALAFQMDGIFIGATWSADMRNMMLVSLIAYVAVWAVATPLIGNHGLWLALIAFLAVRGATLAWRCRARAARAFA